MSRVQRLAGPAGRQGPFVPVGDTNQDKKWAFLSRVESAAGTKGSLFVPGGASTRDKKATDVSLPIFSKSLAPLLSFLSLFSLYTLSSSSRPLISFFSPSDPLHASPSLSFLTPSLPRLPPSPARAGFSGPPLPVGPASRRRVRVRPPPAREARSRRGRVRAAEPPPPQCEAGSHGQAPAGTGAGRKGAASPGGRRPGTACSRSGGRRGKGRRAAPRRGLLQREVQLGSAGGGPAWPPPAGGAARPGGRRATRPLRLWFFF